MICPYENGIVFHTIQPDARKTHTCLRFNIYHIGRYTEKVYQNLSSRNHVSWGWILFAHVTIDAILTAVFVYFFFVCARAAYLRAMVILIKVTLQMANSIVAKQLMANLKPPYTNKQICDIYLHAYCVPKNVPSIDRNVAKKSVHNIFLILFLFSARAL